MRGYTEIASQHDLDALLLRVSGFHDAMTKELRMLNRGHVESDHSMVMSHSFDLQLLVQSQNEPYGIELLMIGVSRLEVTDAREYFEATGMVRICTSPVRRTEVELSFDDSLTIVADRMFSRERSDWLGADAFLGPELPVPNCVRSTPINDKWRQCGSCGGAFPSSSSIEYTRCPDCGQLTVLDRDDGSGEAG